MLNKKNIKDTFALFSSSLVSRLFGLIAGVITARVLGPSDFGLLKIINHVPSLAKFGAIGLSGVVKREVPHIRSDKITSTDKEQKIKSTSFSVDILWGLFLSFAIMIIATFYSSNIITYSLIIASITLFFGSLKKIYIIALSLEKRFTDIAKIEVFPSIITSVIIIATIQIGGIYSVMIGGMIASIFIVIVLMRATSLDFLFHINKIELIRQLKIAIPMTAGTFAFGLFGWVQRGLTISVFGSEVLGYYMLFVFILDGITVLMNNFLRSIAIDLYQKLGLKVIDKETKNAIIKISLIIALLFSLVGGLAVLVAPKLIHLFIPEYIKVIPILIFLIPILVLESSSSIFRLAMNSTTLNMQIFILPLWMATSFMFAIPIYFNFINGDPLFILSISRLLSSILLFLCQYF